jgi:hypothetical protein
VCAALTLPVNVDLVPYLRCYPQFRDEIIEFTADWRACSILKTVLAQPAPDPRLERDAAAAGSDQVAHDAPAPE